MASDLQQNGGNQVSVGELVGGIVSDAQNLLKQQMALFRHEVKEDFRKTLEASGAMAGGALLLLVALIVLSFMLAHWINESAQLSLPTSFGLVGGGLAILGGVLFAGGMYRFKTFNPMPDETSRALQENVRWMTNTK
jgi:hypothetical protein